MARGLIMLEVIGFLVWLFVTIGMTVLPFVLAGISGLGGGMGKGEKLFCVALFGLAIYSWISILSKVSIAL